MNGVLQRKNNDCLNACIASILHVDLASIPDFSDDRDKWWFEVQAWINKHGLSISPPIKTTDDPRKVFQGYTIGSVESRSEYIRALGHVHSVVCRDGVVVWDPQIGEVKNGSTALDYMIIYPLALSVTECPLS